MRERDKTGQERAELRMWLRVPGNVAWFPSPLNGERG
jgi:hypothetical protein